MKAFVFFAVFFLFHFVSIAQPPIFQWARSLSGTGFEVGVDVKVDAAGNVYSVGYFNGTVDFDPGPGTYTLSSVNNDAYICKLDLNGSFLWVAKISGPGSEMIEDFAFDTQGNLLLTGVFSQVADFDPGAGTFTLSCSGFFDVFVCKFDNNGSLIWANKLGSIGSTSQSRAYSLDCDAVGNIYAVGEFEGVVDFDPGNSTFSLTTSGSKDAYVCSFTSSGAFAWVRRFKESSAASVAIGKNAEVFVAGTFFGTVDFDPGPGTSTMTSSSAQVDFFIMHLTNAGNFVWGEQMGGTGGKWINELVADKNNDLFLSGNFEGTIDLDPTAGILSANSMGLYDSFILKLQASGTFLWARQIGGTNEDYTTCIDLDTLGNVYVAGNFSGTTDFDMVSGSYTLSSFSANRDAFIAKFGNSGAFNWAAHFGGLGHDIPLGIAVDSALQVHTTGYYQYVADFDPASSTYTMMGAGNLDAFVHKLSSCIVPSMANNVTPSFHLGKCASSTTTLLASGNGTIHWYSSPTGGSVIATGQSFVTPALGTGTHTFFVEAVTCTNSAIRTAITVTIEAVMSASSTRTVICVGESTELQANGSALFTWNNGSTGSLVTVFPVVTTTFVVTGSNNNLFCANNASVAVNVWDCADINERSDEISFELYPNPATDDIVINSGNAYSSVFEICDIKGCVIHTEKIEPGKTGIHVKKIPPGIYFVRCGSLMKKLIIY
jgi:hypothetical protein